MHTRLAALVAVRYVPVIAPAETGGLEAVYEKLLGLASLNLRLDEVDVGACVGKCTASVFRAPVALLLAAFVDGVFRLRPALRPHQEDRVAAIPEHEEMQSDHEERDAPALRWGVGLNVTLDEEQCNEELHECDGLDDRLKVVGHIEAERRAVRVQHERGKRDEQRRVHLRDV